MRAVDQKPDQTTNPYWRVKTNRRKRKQENKRRTDVFPQKEESEEVEGEGSCQVQYVDKDRE